MQSDNADDSQRLDSETGRPRTGGIGRWQEWCALSAYAAIVAFAIPYHEPWADEAQAWQLARSLSLKDLFTTYVRYEASPGLWHFLLWVLNRAHIGYTGLHWICGAIAVASSFLLIFKSPLPRCLKFTFPLTYFLMFQYAVVARNYVLVPPLLFAIAACWKKRPILLALLLGLLANVSLHAAVISGGLATVFAIEQVGDSSNHDREHKSKLLWTSAVLLVFWAFAIWTAWPPHDFMQRVSNVRGQAKPFPVNALLSLVWGICEPWPLSIAFWIGIVVCFRGRRKLVYLLPVLLFAVFSGAVHVNWWHAGLLVPLIICLYWITFPAPSPAVSRSEWIGRGAFALLIVVQLLWAGYAVVFDHVHAYSPDLVTAQFLRPYVSRGDTILVTRIGAPPEDHNFWAVGIQPYFEHNIFANQPDSFWWWSDKNRTEERFLETLPSHPPMVVAEMLSGYFGQPVNMENAKIRLLTQSGYRLTHVFCGVQPQRLAPGPANCHLIFQYPAGAGTAGNP